MQNKKLPIRKIVSYLNNTEADGGGFWLPNIQRRFVWKEEQICRLFDSIMREYPISVLLVWRTKEPDLRHRKFIDHYKSHVALTTYNVTPHAHSKLLVLDGQQRLQSLYIGLTGSYEGRELYFNVLSGAKLSPEDIRYEFEFRQATDAPWPWVKFKDLVHSNKLSGALLAVLAAEGKAILSADETERAQQNIERARQEFVNDDNITYQELDAIDKPDAYTQEDVVEIFIRANSGGTKLGKTDLLFALLSSGWEVADEKLEQLLDTLNQGTFGFDRDFVLKCALVLLNMGAKYDVRKFRDPIVRGQIEEKWDEIELSLFAVRDWLTTRTMLRTDKAITSYNALLPLVYSRYHFPDSWPKASQQMRDYLLRAMLNGVFGGANDAFIDKLTRTIVDRKGFDESAIQEVIQTEGRSLSFTEEQLFDQSYESRGIHLLFNLLYSDVNYQPAMTANGPQIDHIFPQALLKKVKRSDPTTGKSTRRYYKEDRNQLGNLMLLTAIENGAGGKSDMPPHEWFAASRFDSVKEQQEYLERHLIPKDESLWAIDRFEEFIVARKKLILSHFAPMLTGRSS